MWYFLYHIERSAIPCKPNLNVFIYFEEYFAILQLLRKCAESLERLEGIIVKESRKSDRIERKQNLKKKRRRLYGGRRENKAFVGFSSQR